MVRAPCCEKKGLKRGPWTPEEDALLTSYIQNHGHSNWRALPKLSGLLRCGKSCRLRWINYLKPDIKRGNFTKEEEDTIIHLHQTLGNRWSAIAAKLPGRTDNEIKNVWHTHLKKRANKDKIIDQKDQSSVQQATTISCETETGRQRPLSSQQSFSSSGGAALSSVTTDNSLATAETSSYVTSPSLEDFPVLDESLWSDPVVETGELVNYSGEQNLQFDTQLSFDDFSALNPIEGMNGGLDDSMDFWYDLFVQAGGVEGAPLLEE